jgi:alpha/beta superfamily hydrolase
MTTPVEALTITASDGCELEAELARVPGARARMVLCHPHPQYGGTMRSIVISALFDALPRVGVTCLRFNFRGVENSGGEYGAGHGERLDAHAAIEAIRSAGDEPLVLAGWSFGGDVALTTVHDAIAAWLAVAPPLHVFEDFSAVARDARPKLLALAEHDEIRAPSEIVAMTADWVDTEHEIVGGASHFFVGRTDRLVELAERYVDRVGGVRPS